MILLCLQIFWMRHSARCTLPTWAAALRFSKEDRNYLGRWAPEQSDEYNRIATDIRTKIQATVAEKLRTPFSNDMFHEESLFDQLDKFARVRGYESQEIGQMLDELRHTGFAGNVFQVPEVSDEEIDVDAESGILEELSLIHI